MAHCLERLLVLYKNVIGRKRRASIDQSLMRGEKIVISVEREREETESNKEKVIFRCQNEWD